MAGTDIDLCRPAVHQVVAFKEFPALGIELGEVVVHILCFVLVQGDGHTAQGIDAGIKGFHVYFDVMIHHRAKVIGDDLVHDLHGAQGSAPLIAQGIGQGQLCPAAVGDSVFVQDRWDIHQSIPQEGGHGDGFGFLIHRDQNHGVGVFAVLPFPGILTDQQHIDDLAGFAVIRVCGLGLGGFRRNRFRLLGGVFRQQAGKILGGQAVVAPLGTLNPVQLGNHKSGAHGAHQQNNRQKNHQDGQPDFSLFIGLRC